LTLLYRARGDTTSLIDLAGEDNPLDLLAWINLPHIQPWITAIRAAHNAHRQLDTQLALTRALKDITRILDLEADSTLRIRAINAVIRLANAIHRSLPAEGRAGVGLANSRAPSSTRAHVPEPEVDDPPWREAGSQTASRSSNHASPSGSDIPHPTSDIPHPLTPAQRLAKELYWSQERVEDANCILSTNLERRAEHKTNLEDATAPIGATPSWARNTPSNPIDLRAGVGLASSRAARLFSLPAEGRAGVRLAERQERRNGQAPHATPPHLNGNHKPQDPKPKTENPRRTPHPRRRK
jgi:hypothetical protein